MTRCACCAAPRPGHALVFFPEGTFDEEPGLKRFHVGAFAAAVRGSMPVVPAVIHGARRAMPNKALLVRPGRVRVEILAPIDVSRVGAPSPTTCGERRGRASSRGSTSRTSLRSRRCAAELAALTRLRCAVASMSCAH